MLACARIGAVHSVVFGGFSPESLIDRIDDCTPRLIVTSDGGYRGGRMIDMKKNVDAALEQSQAQVGERPRRAAHAAPAATSGSKAATTGSRTLLTDSATSATSARPR